MLFTMRKLLVYTLLLWLVLILATRITVAVARTQPTPFLVRQLHLTDCALPCWARITPGQTTGEEAYHHLRELAVEVYYRYDRDESHSSKVWLWDEERQLRYQTRIFLSTQNGVVSIIEVPFRMAPDVGEPINQFMPNLGDVIAIYGLPMCFVPDSSLYGRFIYKTPAGALHIYMYSHLYGSISPKLSQPVVLGFRSNKNDNTCDMATARPLRSLADLSRLLAEP
jgi:hypothetical protein